jgi:Sulfocyanin (SoxE) domain
MESHASYFATTIARRVAQAGIRSWSSRAARTFALSLTVWLLSVTFAAADLPNWVTARPQARLVILQMDAGVGDANQGLNFNGHHDGSHRVMVPLGWTVIVRMRNSDPRVPHSALVTKVYRQEEMPERLGPQDTVFPGAATPVPFNGTAAGGYAEFTFVANQAGRYLVACGVQTHLQAGMWLRLDILEGLAGPDLRHDH